MKHALEEDLLLKRFLLGELPEGERGDVEERLFSDPEYFRLFRAAEEELTDEYIYGDLDAAERERFERYFLTTPERRESLRVARALKQYISRNVPAPEFADAAALDASATHADTNARAADAVHVLRPEKRSFFDFLRAPALRYSLAAAAALIVAVSLWPLTRTALRDRPDPTLQANTSDPQPSPQEVAQVTPEQNNSVSVVQTTPTPAGNVNGDTPKDGGAKPPKPPRQTQSRVYLSHILPLTQVRDEGGGQQNVVKLPSDAGVASLRIYLGDDSGRGLYRVTLQTDAGERVKSWANLKPSEDETVRTVNVNVPASKLTRQNYRLVLAAANGRILRTYHFKVTRQK